MTVANRFDVGVLIWKHTRCDCAALAEIDVVATRDHTQKRFAVGAAKRTELVAHARKSAVGANLLQQLGGAKSAGGNNHLICRDALWLDNAYR